MLYKKELKKIKNRIIVISIFLFMLCCVEKISGVWIVVYWILEGYLFIIKAFRGQIEHENIKDNYANNQKDNLYEELQDSSTKDYYKYDQNDISQEEIHEHREDFWNGNSPIKYK